MSNTSLRQRSYTMKEQKISPSQGQAYLSPQASGKNLINGVNFASGSDIYDETARLYL